MVKHIVMQKFNDKNDAIQAKKMLLALIDEIPTLLTMEVGIDELCEERSYDLVLIATFKDMDALRAYDKHPAHEEVRAFIKPRRCHTASVDFTF